MIWIYYLLLIALVFLVILAIQLKDLLYSVISLAGAGIIMTILFFLLNAPDIAITQGVIGAGILTVLYIIAIKRTRRLEE